MMNNKQEKAPRFMTCLSTKKLSMNMLFVGALLLLFAIDASALPKIGYYKEKYSAGHGTYGCAHVTSNTKTVTIMGKSVTYFEMTNADGANLVCIPKVFVDTDGITDDGDPARLIFASPSDAFCTAVGANGGFFGDVSFDATHVFAIGDSYFATPLGGNAVIIKQKERQTAYDEFYSSTTCP